MIQVFKNSEFGQLRTVEINGEIYFVGKDVAEILGYANTRDALAKHVDDEDKNTVAIHDGIPGNPNQTVINESGLYALIFSSKLPTAKKFKHWVTSEVLPSIRKHGAYLTPATIEKFIAEPDFAIKLLENLKYEREEKKKLQIAVEVQNQQIAELRPKASYYDVVLKCKDLLTVGAIAKDFGISAKTLNKILHEKKVQYKQGDIWLLYQNHASKGYTSTKTHLYVDNNGISHAAVHTYWTQKGRLFIYDLLKSEGTLPLIEREL